MEDKGGKKEWDYYKTAHPDRYMILKDYARGNRKDSTTPELIMWEYLRGKQQGAKFRRQHPIGDYIADFVCLEKNIVIEIDGGYHSTEEQLADDKIREDAMARLGFETLRFSNEEVMNDLEGVLEKIRERVAAPAAPPPTPPHRGEGGRLRMKKR